MSGNVPSQIDVKAQVAFGAIVSAEPVLRIVETSDVANGCAKPRTMFEISYRSDRLAVIDAADRETAKRRFAAYALYDDATHVASDVEVAFGEGAEIAPHDFVPIAGTRTELRAWLTRHDDESEAFEPALFEEPDRSLDAYLRVLATNDPWRLEGHGYLGKVLSKEPIVAELMTFDGRITYEFDATQFVDYLRDDVAVAIDSARPEESLRIAHLIDVSALHDEGLRQIASSYDSIARELTLTLRFASEATARVPYTVRFQAAAWQRYLAGRIAAPERFRPPAGWMPAYASYGGDATV